MVQRKTDKVPVYQLSYRLAQELYKIKVKLPKVMKYDLGEITTKSVLRLLHAIVVANQAGDKTKPLKVASLEIENLWVFTRLMFDLKGISQGEFKVLSESLHDIEKQLYNWGSWAKRQAPYTQANQADKSLHAGQEKSEKQQKQS